MNSGTFHVSSQEWRYFSREKSIIHTLHLGQLPDSDTGDTVLIAATPPTSGSVPAFPHVSFPTIPYPTAPTVGIPTGTFACWAYYYSMVNNSIPIPISAKNASISTTSDATYVTVSILVGQPGVYLISAKFVATTLTTVTGPPQTTPQYMTVTAAGTQLVKYPLRRSILVTVNNVFCTYSTSLNDYGPGIWSGLYRMAGGGVISMTYPNVGAPNFYAPTVNFSAVKLAA